MNYDKMRILAQRLLKSFGNSKSCILVKREDGKINQYKGFGVKLDYNSEAVGSNDNMIKAGDAKLLCLFETAPSEMTDMIKFSTDTFNIINVGELNPAGATTVLYTLQIRRT